LALAEGFNETVRGSARGSLLLMTGQIVSTIVSALTIIIVARLLGPGKYGVVTVVMAPIQDLGVNTALTRYIVLNRQRLRGVDCDKVPTRTHGRSLVNCAV